MKKILNVLLCTLIAFLGVPLRLVFASDTIATPPIFVSPLTLNQMVNQLEQDVLNKERVNRDEELSAKELAQENADLIKKLQEMEKSSQEFSERVPGDLYASIQTLDQLREVMDNYSRQLEERNRQLMARNEQNIDLKERINAAEELYNKTLKRNKELESMQSSQPKEDLNLIASLEEKRNSLLEKDQALTQQQNQILEFKAQLERAQANLQEANRRYEDLLKKGVAQASQGIVEQPASVASPKEIDSLKQQLSESNRRFDDLQQQHRDKIKTIDNLSQESLALNKILNTLKSETVRFQESQNALKSKDDRLAQLQEELLQKDAQIAQLKSNLITVLNTLDQAKQELTVKDKALVDQQQAINSFGQEIGEFKENFTQMKGVYDHYDSGFDQIREKIVNLKDKLVAAQGDAVFTNENEQRLIKFAGEVAALSYQVQTGQEDVKKLSTTVDELTAKLQDKEKNLQEKDNDLKDKTKKVLELEKNAKDIEVYQGMIKKVQVHVKDLAQEVGQLKTDVAELLNIRTRAGLYETLVAKYHTLDGLHAQKAGLLIELAQKNKDKVEYYKDQLKKTVLYWQDLNKESIQKLEELEKQARDKQEEAQKLHSQLKDSQQEMVQLESMLDVYQQKLDDKDADYQKREQQVNALSGELMNTQQTLTQRETDLKKIQEYFFELEKKSSQKSEEIREKSKQIALMNETLSQKNQDLGLLEQKLIMIQEKAKSSDQSTQVQTLNASMETLERRTADSELKLMSQTKEQTAKHQEILEAASNEIVALKSALKDKEIQIEELNKKSQGNVELQKQLEQAKAKVKSLMEDLYFKDKEIQRLKMQYSSKDSTIKSMTKKADKVAVSPKNPSYDRTEDLKVQIKQARVETDNAKATAHDKNIQIQALSAQIKKLNDKIHNLEGGVKNLKGNRES